MAMQSLLAKAGLRLATLGTSASLAFAFPLSEGSQDPACHTASNRTGFYATMGAGTESINTVLGGVTGPSIAHVGTGTQLALTASVTGGAPFNVPQGTAPAAPNNGDMWSTASGLFAQIAGVTYTLTAPGGAPIGGSITSGQVAFGQATANEIQGSANLTYVATLGSGGLTIANTTASTTTATGALILSGGLGLAGAINAGANSGITSASGTQLTLTSSGGNAQVAFVPNAGTTYNVGSNGTNVFIFNGTANVLTVGGSSTTNSTITLTAATGHNPVLIYAINGVSEFETYASGGGNYFMGDIVNGTTPMSYTGGAIGAGFVTFANTLDASNSTTAGHVLSGGLAVAKAINAGGLVIASGTTSSIQSGSSRTTYLAAGSVAFYRSGGTITPNTGDMVFQSDITGTNGFYWAAAAATANVMSLTGAGNLTCNGSVTAGTNSGGQVQVNANAAAGNIRGFRIFTAGSSRWQIYGNSDAESGSNAGTTFFLAAYDDTGTFIDNPINITRASAGRIILGGSTNRPLSIGGTSNPTANTFGGNTIWGRNNAAADTAGAIGETMTQAVTGVAAASTGSTGNVATITLTAGKWIISGIVLVHAGTTGLQTNTTFSASIATSSAGNGTSGVSLVQFTTGGVVANSVYSQVLTGVVVNVSTSTQYWLTANVSYTAGSPTFDGNITAQRIA